MHGADLTAARRELVLAAHKKAVVFALNLGLDVAYVTGGSVAILASQLGVDHPARWLAGGLAAAAGGWPALGASTRWGALAAQKVHF